MSPPTDWMPRVFDASERFHMELSFCEEIVAPQVFKDLVATDSEHQARLTNGPVDTYGFTITNVAVNPQRVM